MFLGYLERVKPEGHEQLKQIRNSDASEVSQARQTDSTILRYGQVRLLGSADSGWIDRGPDTLKLINEHKQAQCPGKRAKPCWLGLE